MENETLIPTAEVRYRRTTQGNFSMSAPNGIDVREVLVLQQRFETPGGREVWRDVPVVDAPEVSG